jgi:hypothetical protein
MLAPNEASLTLTIEATSTPSSEASLTPKSKARSIATSMLPAKPDRQRGECEHSTATSLLPAMPDPQLPAKLVSPLPAKPDPPLPACFQQSQIVREVGVIIPLLPACSL